MDGVLADMWGAVAKQEGASHWRKARKIKDRIDQVARKPGFFLHLKPLPNASKLVNAVLKLAGKYSILSSPMMSNVEQSTREKAEWLQHYLKRVQPQSVLFDHDKYKFAQQADNTPNILIDDWESNIRLWEANGGIGILYKDDEIDRVLKQLKQALATGTANPRELDEETVDSKYNKPRLLTNQEVLKYIKGIHHDYSLDSPVMDHKTWILKRVPVSSLNTPENYDQDDPYRRVIDLDWDHIGDISLHDIENRPVVADANGWLLDGNHRATAARARGMATIPAIVPYTKS